MVDIDLSAFDKADEAEMELMLNGRATGWKWTFAGPGHPQTLAYRDKMQREQHQLEREQAQARAAGKRWTPPDDGPDANMRRTVEWIVSRLIRWTPATVTINGESLPYSPDAARRLLTDPRKPDIFTQAVEFLTAETSFTPASARA